MACNLKTTNLLDCALIGACAVIRSNMVYNKHSVTIVTYSDTLYQSQPLSGIYKETNELKWHKTPIALAFRDKILVQVTCSYQLKTEIFNQTYSLCKQY